MTTEQADFMPTADLLEQEKQLIFDTLDEVTCYEIGAWIADSSVRNWRTVTVAVFLGDRLVYKTALPGTSVDNDVVIEGKRRVSLLGPHASLYERNRYLELGTTFQAATGMSLPDYAPFGGAVPLLSPAGDLLGLVIVSGLTQEEDHDLAIAGIEAVREGHR